MRTRKFLAILGLVAFAALPAGADDRSDALTSFEAASVVIGQKNFKTDACTESKTVKPSAKNLCGIEGPPFVAGSMLFIPDSGTDRVLGYKKVPTKNDAAARLVLGQSNFKKDAFGTGSSSFDFAARVASDGTHLFVVDFSNSRVLIWNSIPTTTDKPADVVVGQPNFSSNTPATTRSGLDHPEGMAVAGGKLFISDRNNNRILIWNSIPTANGAAADVVVGQTNFTSAVAARTQTGLDMPEGIWSDGSRLVAADIDNGRVLIWNTVPTSNGAAADVVVGEADFTSIDNPQPPTAQSMEEPSDVASDGTRLFVADFRNSRILVYDPFPTTNFPEASVVLGQPDFFHSDANLGKNHPSAQSLDSPWGVSISGSRLFVSDLDNARALIYKIK